jgi:hypothetical protein
MNEKLLQQVDETTSTRIVEMRPTGVLRSRRNSMPFEITPHVRRA